MNFGDLEFNFRWAPTLLLALPIPLFVGLGLWQLDRAEEKRASAQTLSERSQLPPYRLDGILADAESLRFRGIRARGTFESEGQIYIENRRHAGRTGFHVITPLRLADTDMRVLVNRGWIPAQSDGTRSRAPAPEGLVEVTGETHIPAPPALVLHGGPEAAVAWGERWPYLTLDLFAAVSDYPLQPLVILQDAGDDGGFVRVWPAEPPKEGMHIGYALQWFAFALIALVLYLRLSLVRRGDREDHQV
jgi:surfeit locus 1 family protein